jgi:hypothetical protein
MVWKYHLSNACRRSNLFATQNGLFGLSMAPDTAFPIIAERCAILDVVAAIVPKSPLNDMVGTERWFAATTNYTPVPVSLEHALTERVPLQQCRCVVLD